MSNRRRRTASGEEIPTMKELREFNIKADRWLQERGEHVGDYRENISRACKLNNAERGAAK